jgi:nucleoside-diphosphate-sugar epimerase
VNIFLTGATGFLGKKLIMRLINQGHSLYLLIRNEKKFKELQATLTVQGNKQIVAVYGDITEPLMGLDRSQLNELENNIEVVYHMAALLSFDEKMKLETFNVNVNGTKNVLEFARQIKVKKFIYVSTAYTVGMSVLGYEKLYSSEREFVNYYEQSKAAGEELVFSYKDEMEVMIMRPAIIIGDSKTGEADTNFALYGLIKGLRIIKRMAESTQHDGNQSFRLLLDGDTDSNLVPVDYVVDVLSAVLKHGHRDSIYNITNTNPLLNKTIFTIIKKAIDFPSLVIEQHNAVHLLSKEEEILNDRLKVFKDYLTRSITFESNNTSDLLKAANMAELDLNESVLEHMITTYLEPKVLVTQ